MPLQTVHTVATLRETLSSWRAEGRRIALVPTMGNLHEGHLSLVRLAREQTNAVCTSIFINPKQFGPDEDYGNYPRTLEQDTAMLAEAGVELVYAPSVQEIYPNSFATTVSVSGLTDGLCGASRPGHFDGVATVVAKLLIQAQPDVAVFGQKDFQQLQIIRRLVRDLDLPVQIEGAPIVRESDGLALSSRNRYLTEGERQIAPLLYKTLRSAAEQIAQGGNVPQILDRGFHALMSVGFRQVDYMELREEATLSPLSILNDRPARLFVAAHLGKARLIDNVVVQSGR